MTTSIAFEFEGFTEEEEIENFDFTTFNENYENNIKDKINEDNENLDISGALYALQRLRILKTRETGNRPVVPNTTGRVENTMFNYNERSYDSYKMRRKAEVLKYKQTATVNKRTQYSALVQSRKGNIGNVSKVVTNCENEFIRSKKGTNSGIKGDNTLLFLNSNFLFVNKL